MHQYLELLDRTMRQGQLKLNRTGVPAKALRGGAMMQFDLRDGFPIVTTKAMNFKSIVGELCGFLRGYTSAAQFRALGCNIWNANANDPGLPGSPNAWLDSPHRQGEDDLGRIYGAQWRTWNNGAGGCIDQLYEVVNKVVNKPDDRRNIISAWRPDEFEQMALPPCHVLYQFSVTNGELDLIMYQRSCDMFLGVPFNISSAALLLVLVALVTNKRPRHFTHMLGDVHVYQNHFEQVAEQLDRPPRELPSEVVITGLPGTQELERMSIAERVKVLETVDPYNIRLVGYDPAPAIKAPMAV